ncbi:MAG TPA: phosphoglycerate mutase [Rhodanobacteraceae bacterium]|nr:phosphoglycerate mutase [Rhodanobacteraceae bacterium]
MSTLHVLLPPLARIGEAPAWRGWLARGDRLPVLQHARTATLRDLFRFAGATLPAAALRHHCHADDAGSGAWLCADPAWVRSEATGARLMAWPLEDVGADEAMQLARTLQPLFGDAGTPLTVDTPSAWCLRLPHDTPRATFVDPGDALGADLLECLPQGDGGRVWRRLFNEAQVALHVHPVNAARIASGKRPVNALWFWGAGTLPGTIEVGVQAVASVDDVLRGMARLAGAVRVEPLPEALESIAPAGATLLDLDVPGHADAAAEWLAPFQRWLRERRFDAIAITFAGGERFRLRHAHRLRFWRRA